MSIFTRLGLGIRNSFDGLMGITITGSRCCDKIDQQELTYWRDFGICGVSILSVFGIISITRSCTDSAPFPFGDCPLLPMKL